MQNLLTVTTLNNQIKSLLESHYLSVQVEGEVSRVTYHSSGHLYFTLKDASSSISCVMFKGNNQKLKFRVEEGMHIIIFGGISVYTPRGSYQINCMTMQPAGEGALSIAFEQLKKRLQERGFFEESRKKPLPKMPKHIVLVTSKTGAAIEDMKRVAQKRWRLLKITLIDTIVQGEQAADAIAKNIMIADSLGADIIVIGRGGGSLEDLWAFNEEIVAEAIYHAKTPIVSAVGHEIDTMISDFCADFRAPTPSAAMELILPDQVELSLTLDTIISRYHDSFRQILHKKQALLSHQEEMLKQHAIERKLHLYEEEIKNLKVHYHTHLSYILQEKKRDVTQCKEHLSERFQAQLREKISMLQNLKISYENNNPQKREKKGFAEIVKEGKRVALESLKEGEMIVLQSASTIVEAKVETKKTIL
jgi:exodeoxyribonuclease VII large subunit